MAGQRTPPGTEIATKTPMQHVLAEIASDGYAERLRRALPENVSVQRFQSIAVTAVKQNPELITGDHETLYTAIVRCAQDGLTPDGREAALVIFGNKVQYMPMITGLRKRLAEFGFDLTAYVVYENDAFDYALGAEPWVTHKPPRLGEERGKPIGAYAVAVNFATRRQYIDVMDVAQIEKVRKVSKTANRGPWVDWWDEQARKTVARRLTKTLPLADVDAVASLLSAIDDEYELPSPNGKPMTESEANATSAASTSDVPLGDRQKLREEPKSDGPSDAQLNRIAELQGQVEERMWRATLRGVFGVDDPAALTPEEADRYEQTLHSYAEHIEDGEFEPIVGQDGQEIVF